MHFDKARLLDAFDRIGAAAVENGTRLEFLVYGGSALMLTSDFRFSTEDVDIAELPKPWPGWLTATAIANRNGWSEDWLNEAVSVHLSPLATRAADHLEYGGFPRDAPRPGLLVTVPTDEYLLALKLKAMRTLDPVKGQVETDDIYGLMRRLGITDAEAAIAVMAKFFPVSAQDGAKQRFLPKHLAPSHETMRHHAPRDAS